jgi:hypothetical protein
MLWKELIVEELEVPQQSQFKQQAFNQAMMSLRRVRVKMKRRCVTGKTRVLHEYAFFHAWLDCFQLRSLYSHLPCCSHKRMLRTHFEHVQEEHEQAHNAHQKKYSAQSRQSVRRAEAEEERKERAEEYAVDNGLGYDVHEALANGNSEDERIQILEEMVAVRYME